MQLTLISSMIKKKGMILKKNAKKQRNEPSLLLLAGVRSGLKLGCVASTSCAAKDAQMSPSGARSVFCFVLFFLLLSLPCCSLGLFAKHLGC